jgi:hypothetical protein
MTAEPRLERKRSALTTLSAVGAALAGAGVGVLLGDELRPLAWWILAIGILAHLVGMAGVRKLLAAAGYDPPAWQVAAYWLCWAAIAAIVGYGLLGVVR